MREGELYGIDGEKVFITPGARADVLTVAVLTGEPGARGISLIVLPGDAPGMSRRALKKIGWWRSDKAQIYFDGVPVPADNMVGEEGAGFRGHGQLQRPAACAVRCRAQLCVDLL